MQAVRRSRRFFGIARFPSRVGLVSVSGDRLIQLHHCSARAREYWLSCSFRRRVGSPKEVPRRVRVVVVPVSALHQGHGCAGGWTAFWTPNQNRSPAARPPNSRTDCISLQPDTFVRRRTKTGRPDAPDCVRRAKIEGAGMEASIDTLLPCGVRATERGLVFAQRADKKARPQPGSRIPSESF